MLLQIINTTRTTQFIEISNNNKTMIIEIPVGLLKVDVQNDIRDTTIEIKLITTDRRGIYLTTIMEMPLQKQIVEIRDIRDRESNSAPSSWIYEKTPKLVLKITDTYDKRCLDADLKWSI